MGLFSSALLAELEKGVRKAGAPETYPLLKLQAPGQTFLWTSRGFGSLTHGVAEERVQSWGGEFGPDVDPLSDQVQSWEMSVELVDLGESAAERRQLAREVATYRRTLRRSTATLYPFASPNVADADTFSIPLLFVTADQTAEGHWRIRLKPDDTVLQYGVLPRVPLQPYFQNIHPSVQGHYAPVVYGIHDSNSANGKGFVPCLYVDTVGFRYLISIGRVKTLKAVYKDGVLVTSGYSLTYVTLKGTVFSLVDFTADQGANAEITADVEGLTTNADGTGDLISNPVRQWAHAVTNFGYNDWRQGSYFADTTAPHDTAALTAAAGYLDDMGYEGSFYIPGDQQQKLIDFTNKFLADHPLFGYWGPDAKLTLGFLDHRPPATLYPTGSAHVEGDVDEEDGFETLQDAEYIEKEIDVQYIKSESTGEYHASLKVADLSIEDEVSGSLQLDWAARRVS